MRTNIVLAISHAHIITTHTRPHTVYIYIYIYIHIREKSDGLAASTTTYTRESHICTGYKRICVRVGEREGGGGKNVPIIYYYVRMKSI